MCSISSAAVADWHSCLLYATYVGILQYKSEDKHAEYVIISATVWRCCCGHFDSMTQMQAELKMSGITNIGMHNLSPGMVTTDLLMSGQRISHHELAVQDKLHRLTCQLDMLT